MRRRIAFLIALLSLCIMPAALAEDAFLYNGDFALIAQDETLPAGWYYEAWEPGEGALAYLQDGAVVISSAYENDARICQRVSVSPDTLYRITCEAMAQDVAGTAGAAITILDTFASSAQLFGGEGWQPLSLTGRTGPEQTEFIVALRLGGYGALSSGTAQFRNVQLEQLDAASDDETIESFGPLRYDDTDETDGSDLDEMVFALFGMIALALGLCSYLVYRRHIAGGASCKVQDCRMKLLLLLCAAVLLRLFLSLIFVGHSTDIACFAAWADGMAQYGPANFYTSISFSDYPPGYLYVLWVLGGLQRLFQLSYHSPIFVFLLKLPAITAELLSAYLAYRYAVRQGAAQNKALAVFAVLAFQPAFAFISGGWGQIDSILTLCLLGAILLFQKARRIEAGALYGLAILIKPQALMLGPILALAYFLTLRKPNCKRALFEMLLAVAAAVVVILLGALPFAPEPGFGWLFTQYFSTATSYPYASIEAFNLFALFGGNWTPVDSPLLFLPYSTWGVIGIALSALGAGFLYWKGRKGPAPLLLAGAFLLAGVFTLGHFMHERYLYPALILLLFAYLAYDDRRLFVAFSWLSVTLLLNVLAAFVIVDHQYLRGSAYDLFTRFCSLLTVLGFGYLCYVCCDLVVRSRCMPSTLYGKLPVQEAPAQPVLEPIPVSTDAGSDKPPRFSKRDQLYCWGLTAVYAAFALTNLGSLSAPETYYYSNTPGEETIIRFAQPVDISEYWIYGGIADGKLMLRADHGAETVFEQTNDEMFRWVVRDATALGTLTELSLITYSGTLWLNEIAFFDAAGNRIAPISLTNSQVEPDRTIREYAQATGPAALFDEPQTIPDYPSYFNGMYFDELYHARTAYEHLHGIDPYENSHPPLGKVFIMLGVALCGMNPFGWRIIGALFGVGMIPIFYLFSRRLFRKSDYALLASGLFAFDFMHFTQTRIATIDGFSVFFILLMFYFMYEYYTMSFYTDGLRTTLRPLALAGLFFGLGAATKWICIYAGGGLAVLLLLSLLKRYREYREALRAGDTLPFAKYTIQTLLWCCLFYIAVPVSVYLLSYLPYFLCEKGYGLRDVWTYQQFMWSYHSNLDATHPYQSSWWQWPFTLRPMWYCWSADVPAGLISTLTASGNPAVWWTSTIGAAALVCQCALRRVRVEPGMTVAFVGICANFLPWVLVSRCTFIYHFFATVPFLLLCAIYALWSWERTNLGIRWVKWVWLGACVALFLLLYPGLSGLPIPSWWADVIKLLPGGHLMYGA